MKILIDLDSLLYTSVYKVVSYRAMYEAIENYGKENARLWLNETVLNESVNWIENVELIRLQEYIEILMINALILEPITGIELFITTCKNNFRKEIDPEYKANRKRNKWVGIVRDYYQIQGVHYSDTLEADDLIAIRAKELGIDNCVIATNDKDLKQIGGHYFSYYKQNVLDKEGIPMLNELGQNLKEYKQKEMIYMTPQDAQLFFYSQMLIGDNSDNIKGIKGIGVKTAPKILKGNYFINVAREYLKRGQKGDFWNTYRLLKLG